LNWLAGEIVLPVKKLSGAIGSGSCFAAEVAFFPRTGSQNADCLYLTVCLKFLVRLFDRNGGSLRAGI
jgi:hypothetical protein